MSLALDSFLFPKRATQLASLEHFLSSTTPLMLLLGEPGSDKQGLLDELTAKMQLSQRIVRLQGYSGLQPAQLTGLLAHHWRIEAQESNVSQRYPLEQIILDLEERDEYGLLVVENAQTLPVATLAALSHLAIKQDGARVHLHILLSGTTELSDKASSLQSEPIPHIQLKPLSFEETRNYIERFFQACEGCSGLPELSQELFEKIYRQSAGHPHVVKQITQELTAQEPALQKSPSIRAIPPKSPYQNKRGEPAAQSFWGRHAVKIISLSVLSALIVGLSYQKNHSQPRLVQQLTQQEPSASPEQSSTPVDSTANNPEKQAPTAIAAPIEEHKKAPVAATPKPQAKKTAAPQHSRPSVTTDKPKLTGYTLQLLGSHRLKAVQTFIKQHHLGKNGRIIKTTLKGKVWYIVTYGHFTTRQQASAAIKHLPPSLQKLHPWARSLKNL